MAHFLMLLGDVETKLGYLSDEDRAFVKAMNDKFESENTVVITTEEVEKLQKIHDKFFKG